MNTFFQLSERQERILRAFLDVRRTYSLGEVSIEWVIVSLCTTLESACVELLEQLLHDRAKMTTSKLEGRLIASQRRDMNRTWMSRLEWLSKGFDLTIDRDLRDELLTLVELRNAIVHKGHAFTDRQIENYGTALQLRATLERAFYVTCRGVEFDLTPKTADVAFRIARDVTASLLR